MSDVPRLFEWSAVGKSSAVPQVGFKHHKDYVGYVWAKQEESDFLRQEHQVTWTWEAEPSRVIVFFSLLPFHWLRQDVFQVTFTEEELPKGSGDFILGYYSNNMSTVVGVTEPFQVIIPRLHAVIARFSPTLHRSSHTHSRSSSPLRVLTTVLQTAPTSAPRTTAPLSWWRQAPRVPARAGANTAATTAAAAPAAPSRPRSKHPAGLLMMVLQQTYRRGSLRVAHQRAAASRPLFLRPKLKNQRLKNRGRDAESESVLCVTGHIEPTVVSLVQYIHSNVCFQRGKDAFYNAILFQEQPPACPGGFTLTLPSVVQLICANYISIFLSVNHSVHCCSYLHLLPGVNSVASWHFGLSVWIRGDVELWHSFPKTICVFRGSNSSSNYWMELAA